MVIDGDQATAAAEEPVVGCHLPSLPTAPAAISLAIQPAADSAAPSESVQARNRTWVPVALAAELAKNVSMSEWRQAMATRHPPAATASGLAAMPGSGTATAGSSVTTAAEGLATAVAGGDSDTVTALLANRLHSFLAGGMRQMLEQMSDPVMLAPNALAQIAPSLLSEWGQHARQGAEVMNALQSRLREAHGEAIAGLVEAAERAEGSASAAGHAENRHGSQHLGNLRLGQSGSAGGGGGGSGCGGGNGLSSGGAFTTATQAAAAAADHAIDTDTPGAAQTQLAMLPAVKAQQQQQQQQRAADRRSRSVAAAQAADSADQEAANSHQLRPAGLMAAEEAALPQQQEVEVVGKSAVKRHKTGRDVHGQQPCEQGLGHSVRADSAEQATQLSGAPAELVGTQCWCHASL